MVLRFRHPWSDRRIEALHQIRHRRGDIGHRESDEPAGNRFPLDLPRFALRDISVSHLAEDLPQGVDNAVCVRLPDEDRVFTVEILDVVDVTPLIGSRVRRGAFMVVQDELMLGTHTIINRHLCLPASVMVSTER
jgi:hypothetical protein